MHSTGIANINKYPEELEKKWNGGVWVETRKGGIVRGKKKWKVERWGVDVSGLDKEIKVGSLREETEKIKKKKE